MNRKLTVDLITLQGINTKLQSHIAEKDATIQMKDATAKRKNAERAELLMRKMFVLQH